MFNILTKSGVSKLFVTSHENLPPKEFSLWYPSCDKRDKEKIVFRTMNANDILWNRGGCIDIKHTRKQTRCLMPTNNLVIDANGNVLLCVNDFFCRHIMGNIMEQSIINIWNSKEYIKLRKEIYNGNFKLAMCQRCVS